MKLKILLTSISAVIVIVTLIFFNTNNKEVVDDISVVVELIKDDRVEEFNLVVSNQSFVDSIKENFDVVIENGMLLKIDFLEADGREYFIMININNTFSNKGINSIKLNNNDKVSFIYTKVSL